MGLRTILLPLLLGLVGAPGATPGSHGRLSVSLLTMSPGDDPFTAYGHTAFRIRDLDHPEFDMVYDFGSYDASAPDAGIKFVEGKLPYWLGRSTMERVMRWYGAVFSGITEQVLDVDQQAALGLLERLEVNARPENRYYKYHHFKDNCATRPRDILDDLFHHALRRATFDAPSGQTYRDLIERCMGRSPVASWAIFGLLNGMIDRPITRWERMFLPGFLKQELADLKVPGPDGSMVPAVLETRVLVGEDKPALLPRPSPVPGLVALLLLVTSSALPSMLQPRSPKWAARAAGLWFGVWGLIAGVYGTLIVFAWVVSPYPETKWNWNLLIFHPVWLAGPVLGVGLWRRRRWAHVWAEVLGWLALAGIIVAIGMDLRNVTAQELIPMAAGGLAASLPTLVWLIMEGTSRSEPEEPRPEPRPHHR